MRETWRNKLHTQFGTGIKVCHYRFLSKITNLKYFSISFLHLLVWTFHYAEKIFR